MQLFGLGLDDCGRCCHYATVRDVVALKCRECQNYYACYRCHDELESHSFQATLASEVYPVLCGSCRHLLTLIEYKTGACPYCGHGFNPNCQRHDFIYFSKE